MVTSQPKQDLLTLDCMEERIDFLSALKGGCFSLHLEGTTKREIIEEMIDLMVDAGQIVNRQETVDAVIEREKKMSTGMQFGVALPHGKTASVPKLVVAIGLKKEGIDFRSLDNQPSRIFVMTVSSVYRTGPHIQYLSEMSRLLSCPAVRDLVLAAETRDDIIRALTP